MNYIPSDPGTYHESEADRGGQDAAHFAQIC